METNLITRRLSFVQYWRGFRDCCAVALAPHNFTLYSLARGSFPPVLNRSWSVDNEQGILLGRHPCVLVGLCRTIINVHSKGDLIIPSFFLLAI